MRLLLTLHFCAEEWHLDLVCRIIIMYVYVTVNVYVCICICIYICIYVYMYVCVYIYIYTCICIHVIVSVGCVLLAAFLSLTRAAGHPCLRPISLLMLPLLTLLDSNFPGNPLWAWEFHPFALRLRLGQTL